MLNDKHKQILYFDYKANCKDLTKMCDLLDLFAGINAELVRLADEKKE